MYNDSINTTYLDIKDEKQDTQYRKELLDVFNIEEYKHESIMNCMKNIFKKYGTHKQVVNILKTLINTFKFPIELDQETAFMMMCSFENFYFFHNALCDLERNENINLELYDKIIQNLQKK